MITVFASYREGTVQCRERASQGTKFKTDDNLVRKKCIVKNEFGFGGFRMLYFSRKSNK